MEPATLKRCGGQTARQIKTSGQSWLAWILAVVIVIRNFLTNQSLVRISAEWIDPERPNWERRFSMLCFDFVELFQDAVRQFGPPSKLEFRAHDEGWAQGESSL